MRFNALGLGNAVLGGKYAALLLGEFPMRVFTFLKSIPMYLAIVFLPINLHMERTFAKPMSFFNPWVASTLIVLLLVFFAVYKRKKKRPEGLFLYLWFLLLIFSQSYIVLPGFSFAEHFLYLASVSAFFVLGLGFVRLFDFYRAEHAKQRLVSFTLASLIVFYASLAGIHNLNWKDDLTLYRWTLRFSPKSIKAHLNLANEYFGLGRDDLALVEYEKAKSLLVSVSLAHYQEKPILDKRLNEALTITRYNLGVLYAQKGNFEAAEREYRQVLDINKNFHLARNNLAALLSRLSRTQEALEQLEILLALDPANVQAYYNKGVIYANSGKTKQAKEAWLRGLAFDPGNIKIRSNLESLSGKANKGQ
jgi:tetratricopeptide (TPR) repeat protein